jgi:hypothetical protein
MQVQIGLALVPHPGSPGTANPLLWGLPSLSWPLLADECSDGLANAHPLEKVTAWTSCDTKLVAAPSWSIREATSMSS